MGKEKLPVPCPLPCLLLASHCWGSLGRENVLLAEKSQVGRVGSIQSSSLASHEAARVRNASTLAQLPGEKQRGDML